MPILDVCDHAGDCDRYLAPSLSLSLSFFANPSIAVVKLSFRDARFILAAADTAAEEDEDEPPVSEDASVLSVLDVPSAARPEGGGTCVVCRRGCGFEDTGGGLDDDFGGGRWSGGGVGWGWEWWSCPPWWCSPL